MQSRDKTFFYDMRKFHNNIKRGLYNKYTSNIESILEIAVGRSGDLDKWISNNIKNVVGYDINTESIIEGKKRILQRNEKKIKVELYVKDLSKEVLCKPKKMFDIVSGQFCFHYFFKNQNTFDTMMKSINNNLKYNGYFIGTLFDGEFINNLGNFELSDNKNNLRFKIIKGDENDTPFGNDICVYMNETILNEPTKEYIVNFNNFTKLMKSRGFELIESVLFKDLYNSKFKMDEISKQVSFLNRTFVFKKTLLCIEEIENVLIKCEWNSEIIEYNKKVYEKYINYLNKKISESKKSSEYKYILSSFISDDNTTTNDVSNNIKAYILMLKLKYNNELR